MQEPSKELVEKIEIYAGVYTAMSLLIEGFKSMGYEDSIQLPNKKLEGALAILAGLCKRVGTDEVKAILADPRSRVLAFESDGTTGEFKGVVDLDSL